MTIRGAIVLCGGKSQRMGLPKATLPFGPERMLQRVVRIVSGVVHRVVVVGAPGQDLPELAAEVQVVRDRREGRGPLEGLAAGLAALDDHAQAAFLTGCDVPLLVPGLIERLFALLDGHEIVVPTDGHYHHPLTAVYRTRVRPVVEDLLAQNHLRPVFLFDRCPTLEVPVDQLRDVDADLASLRNLNSPEDYAAALHAAGFPLPQAIAGRLKERNEEQP